MKQRSKVIATSIATIAMCASLAVGGTFALFTSESEVNIAVTSGTVDVKATAGDLTLKSRGVVQTGNTFENLGTATKDGNKIKIDRMTPMDSLNFDIAIENYSDVSVQYRTVISVVEDTGLFSALTVTFTENGTAQVFNGGYAYADWQVLPANGNQDNDPKTAEPVSTINVDIAFPDGENQNGYMGKSCEIAVTVEAVQGNADVVNPVTQTGVRSWDVNNEDGMMLIKGIRDSFTYGGTSEGYYLEGYPLEFTLKKDMNMSGYKWNAPDMLQVNVYGENHTISNLNCGYDVDGQSGFASYFGGGVIKDLAFENVTAKGSQAGILTGLFGGGTFENVTIKGQNNTVEYDKSASDSSSGGVGAIAGVFNEGSLKSGSSIVIADGAKITVAYNGLLTRLTYANEYAFIKDMNADGYITNSGTITTTGDYGVYVTDGLYKMADGSYLVTNANGFKYLSDKSLAKDVVLNLGADIDFDGASVNAIIAARSGSLTVNGNGYTISNVNVVSGANDNTTGQAGLFYCYPNSTLTVKNLKVDGATVQADTNGATGYAAVIVGYSEATTVLSNVDVKNSTVNGQKNAGILVGIAAGTGTLTMDGCDVGENCKVDVTEDRAAAYVGRAVGATTITNCTVADDFVASATEGWANKYIGQRYETCPTCTIDGVEYVDTTAQLKTLLATGSKKFAIGSKITLTEGLSATDVEFIGLTDTAAIDFAGYNIGGAGDITYKNLKLTTVSLQQSETNSERYGWYGGIDYNGHSVANYENCTISGVFTTYSPVINVTDCTFDYYVQDGEKFYNIFMYAGCKLTATRCTFVYGDRAIKAYSEAYNQYELVLTDCKFVADEGYKLNKALINVSNGALTLSVVNNTVDEALSSLSLYATEGSATVTER